MLRYLFISILATLTTAICAQGQLQNAAGSVMNAPQKVTDEEAKAQPKIIVLKDQGLSLGIDLAPFITRIIQDKNTGFAFIGRYGFKNRWWGNAELGYQNTQYSNANFSYKSNGSFIKLGIDYDIFMSEDFPTNDNILVGLRYAYAWQSHEADSYKIVDSYWGDYTGSVGKSSVNSHTLEALFGIRCEVLRNFYMGWSFRCKFLLGSAHDDNLDPYAIAGYGSYDSRVALGFTYTLEYQIPFNKLGKK